MAWCLFAFLPLDSCRKFIQDEIRVPYSNGETRALKLFVDWDVSILMTWSLTQSWRTHMKSILVVVVVVVFCTTNLFYGMEFFVRRQMCMWASVCVGAWVNRVENNQLKTGFLHTETLATCWQTLRPTSNRQQQQQQDHMTRERAICVRAIC